VSSQSNRRRHRDHAGEFRKPERQADDCRHKNSDQRAAQHAPEIERSNQDEAKQHQGRFRVSQIAKGDQSRRVINNNLGFLECNDSEKQADARRYCELEVLRDRVDDELPDAEYGDQEEQHARTEHGGECLLPRVLVGKYHRESEKCIDAHAGRKSDRVVGIERHHHGADRRCDAGRDEHRTLVHSRFSENDGVHEDDVDHR
jgi:hypothetical protein